VLDILLYAGGILVVLLGIALSIGFHEVGHLVPAKLFGLRVKQYMIGFGPTVFSRRKGDTEYGLKAFPLGGYILMEGMYPPESKPYRGPFAKWIREARAEVRRELDPADEDRQFYKLSVPKKLIIMLGGPVMNFFLGIVLIVTALSGLGSLQSSMTINQVFSCVETAADGSCPAGVPESPAALAGLEPLDKVVAISGVEVFEWDQAAELLLKNQSGSSEMVVLRDGVRVTISITPVFMERQIYDDQNRPVTDAANLPVTELRPIIGVQLKPEQRPQPIFESAGFALGATGAMFGFILDLPAQVFAVAQSTFGLAERDPNGAVSILGVGQLAGEVSSADAPVGAKLASLLLLLGTLNIALFAFNLIPLLPLDGGHVVGALYEGAKRRILRATTNRDPGPIDTAKALPLAYVVWALLLFTGLLLIFADIVNPIGFF
jgi:membrane-associated protease RseP (regulator of RpoE activity)